MRRNVKNLFHLIVSILWLIIIVIGLIKLLF
nr:MAG TPA: hypothetical protein [Caudoviricetes sp.]DAP60491.1 MAG TPA: hypothetical protein [Caudoviricetes sp.]DAZ40806.1 MAG TPA: hypothetical protein [Caudoviricetes sp.]